MRMRLNLKLTAGDPGEASLGLRLLLVALTAAVLFHGGLLPFTHGNTYDAFIHMFFGDHYYRSWFDPWEPRWYTGFATTSYPPGTHMAIGALMHLVPLRAAFVVVQLTGILLLTIGVYRFSLLWVPPAAAGYAAIALVMSSSVSETVHLFGQLPTICSLGIFLNGLPYVYRWIVSGRLANFGCAVIFAAATTSAHHVTTIFGGVLFIIPLAAQALRAVADLNPLPQGTGLLRGLRRFLRPIGRGLLLAVMMLAAIAITVFPYWYWSISDPITQVPIPHGSRESFLERPDLGLVFFVLPWGVSALFLPYCVYKTFTTRLWPLGLSVLLCFLLGTGGTTPLPRAILGGAFDILTLDRFTFWASILILPFIGLAVDGLLHGRSGRVLVEALGRYLHRLLVGGLFATASAMAVFCAILPTLQPTQPRFVDPAPIAKFLAEDEHDRWRYLTLGFGDQFAYLSAQTTAHSVDGNYHSARRLPDLTSFSVERLENAKYLGVPGLGSLQQFLINAERYHLKYVFSNDAFYDPLLFFSGWTRLTRLGDGITVWEKPDIPPLPRVLPRKDIPSSHALMWGTIPPTALMLAAAIFLTSATRRNFGMPTADFRPIRRPDPAFANPARIRRVVFGLFALFIFTLAGAGGSLWRTAQTPAPPERVIESYFDHLDFRRFHEAYDLLDPGTRPDFDSVMFNWRWRGGLLASYGKLDAVQVTPVGPEGALRNWAVTLDWITALGVQREEISLRTVTRDGQTFVAPLSLAATQTPVRLQREAEVTWNVVGRRQPRPDTDLHRDRLDRPRIAVGAARLVRKDGRFFVIGEVANPDLDPAMLTLRSGLMAGDDALTDQASGWAGAARLLPGEQAGYRVDFEGVLSLQDAERLGAFDPELHVPLELPSPPDRATIEARALVLGTDLYRGVSLNGLRSRLTPEGKVELTALAVNAGQQTASITRLSVLLYDDANRPVWIEAGFTETNIYPGQSQPISILLPRRDEITVIADIRDADIRINGTSPQSDRARSLFGAALGNDVIPMPPASGYSAARLHLSSMTHDMLF